MNGDTTAVAPPKTPSCKGCGCDVAEGVTFCVVCADQNNSKPRPMFVTENQPTPPEKRLDSPLSPR